MTPLQSTDIEGARRKNIVEMSLGFTGMMRLFSKRSKTKIRVKLDEVFSQLAGIQTSEDYQALHLSFCEWFTREVWSAEKKFENGKIQPSQPSSYGQAAKVLDIVIKVFVYYCGRPSREVADRIVPLLNGAVDTPILCYLKRLPRAAARISATTIKEIDEGAYGSLQALVLAESRGHNMYPVQFDDVMYRHLNRKEDGDTDDSTPAEQGAVADRPRE